MKGLIPETGEFVDIGEAHPVADLFPMLAGEDFEELIASIYEQGLLQPVVLDAEGRVLDGRNRLAACERLDIVPEVTVYEGKNPDGYALTVNLARRHLNKGQRAMLAARSVLISNTRQVEAAQAADVSRPYISLANVVLDHAPDLADAVIAGARSLDDAYKVAQANKKAATDEATQMARLYTEAPDLADLVADETNPMTLGQAIAAYERRVAERQDQRRRFTTSLAQSLVSVWAQLAPDPGAAVQALWDPEANTYATVQADRFTTAGIREAAGLLVALAEHLESEGDDTL